MNLENCLEKVLEVYEPDCRYLKKLTIDGNKAHGEFSVPATCYAIKGRKYHLNAAEDIILYEQIMYAFVGNMFINGLNGTCKIPEDVFFPAVVDEYTFIVDVQARYKKMVDSSFFKGTLTTHRVRKMKNGNYHLKQTLDINDGSHILDVSIYLELKDLALTNTSAAA